MVLAGWNENNKYKLTIDSSQITEDLTNFPISIVISSGTGTNGLDATNIFSELGSDSDKTKIAVTDASDTQLYTEIEHWDITNKRAALWTKVPTVSSGTDTVLYLYYDATQSGNGSYVGETGDIPAQNVWDDDFQVVYHLAQGPSASGTGDILESTSNGLHQTPYNLDSDDFIDTPVGKGINFDGQASTEHLRVSDGSGLTSFGDGVTTDDPMTIECFANIDDMLRTRIIGRRDSPDQEWLLTGTASDFFQLTLYDANVSNYIYAASNAQTAYQGAWYLWSATYNGNGSQTDISVQRDGVDITDSRGNNGTYNALHTFTQDFEIARDDQGSTTQYFNGKIAEVRISRFARSQAYLKATTATLNNSLLLFENLGLEGWNLGKKYGITIDKDQIDDGLIDFPVGILLNNTNTPRIFTEFSSDSDRKKIAVTDVDDNQLYVEIEHWDHSSTRSTIWVKVPTVASGTNTVLYLYYDSTRDDNTTYVGDTGDTPAQNVWDSYFELVYHLAQDPSIGGATDMKDSTSNAIHGRPYNFESEDLGNSPIGKRIDLDGSSSEYVSVPHNSALSFGDGSSSDDPCTIEAFVNMDDSDKFRMIAKRDGADVEYLLSTAASRYLTGVLYDDPNTDRIGRRTADNAELPYEGSWTHYALVYRGTETVGGIDQTRDGIIADTADNSLGSYSAMHVVTSAPFSIGESAGSYANGKFGEVRASRIDRSNAWLRATTQTLKANLLTFEDLSIVFTFSDPNPVHLSTVYGTTQQISLTTAISGAEDSYVYNAEFFDGITDAQIGSTAGISSGSPASVVMNTTSGSDYDWYMRASSSGGFDSSSTYSFTNRFLCAGDVYINAGPASGIPVRLYRRSTGEFVGQTTSTGILGLFQIPSTYNEDHYAVALYSDDTTNALIYDWINPE